MFEFVEPKDRTTLDWFAMRLKQGLKRKYESSLKDTFLTLDAYVCHTIIQSLNGHLPVHINEVRNAALLTFKTINRTAIANALKLLVTDDVINGSKTRRQIEAERIKKERLERAEAIKSEVDVLENFEIDL